MRFYKYDFDRSVKPAASSLQIIRNYQNAAKRLGGQVLFDDGRRTTIRLSREGKNVWVEVWPFNGGAGYNLFIVENEAMQQDVVANAEAFQNGLKESGHVEVPGIFFDFGKSEVKPESEAALKEVRQAASRKPGTRSLGGRPHG